MFRKISENKWRGTRGVWGYPIPENFEKLDCLRQHFVHFEGSLINRKNCIHVIYNKDNNDGKFLLKILLKMLYIKDRQAQNRYLHYVKS